MTGTWLATLKGLLAHVMLVHEYCHDCGRSVRQVWTAHDALWSRLVSGQGPRCIACFDRRATEDGRMIRWVPMVER